MPTTPNILTELKSIAALADMTKARCLKAISSLEKPQKGEKRAKISVMDQEKIRLRFRKKINY